MTPLRFRGLCTSGKAWYVGLLSISQGKTGQPKAGYYISNRAGMPWAYEIRPETVGQSTGLTDRNGKEIFAGDIVKGESYGKEHIFRIEWIGMTGCGCHNGYGYRIPEQNNEPEEWEVIGNIYEDSHLLPQS